MTKEYDVWWDGKGNFLPTRLAEIIMQFDHFIFDRGELYYYDKGVYVPGGNDYVKLKAKERLEDDYKNYRGEEVLHNVKLVKKHDAAKLDDSPTFINLGNGLLDWNTKELCKHNHVSGSTIRIPVQYDPDATCHLIEKFLHEVLPPDCIDLIFEAIGYCLIYDIRFEKAFLFLGNGANGKSTLIKLLKQFLGKDNVATESLQDITENRFRAGNLAGKLVNLFPDLDNRALRGTGSFKALVSGDPITVEKKYKEPFTLENKAKMIFSCNEIPRSYDTSPAFYRRLIIIRFPNSFPEGKADTGLLDKLISGDEFSGLLNKALVGLNRLFKNDKFSATESTIIELRKYREDNENVILFIDEMCKVGNQFEIPISELFETYGEWCEDQGIKAFGKQSFNKQLNNSLDNLIQGRDGTIRTWKGIALKSSDELSVKEENLEVGQEEIELLNPLEQNEGDPF